MSGVVHCRQCKARAIGAVPDAPPVGWEVILANKVFGGGQASHCSAALVGGAE
ncbi:hypothetical protein SPHS6_00380 [Sphingobium sp. S6]|nr:hypothetical protein SPHS8_00380 [Sphingobium sp. S8]CAD7335204.1 hypothetical protein SPHS6_00380 [Sphingobium sp. S6]CAD7335283.1 hypothetical protein SPHS8_00429 [Sphingobium sp. S8]